MTGLGDFKLMKLTLQRLFSSWFHFSFCVLLQYSSKNCEFTHFKSHGRYKWSSILGLVPFQGRHSLSETTTRDERIKPCKQWDINYQPQLVSLPDFSHQQYLPHGVSPKKRCCTTPRALFSILSWSLERTPGWASTGRDLRKRFCKGNH